MLIVRNDKLNRGWKYYDMGEGLEMQAIFRASGSLDELDRKFWLVRMQSICQRYSVHLMLLWLFYLLLHSPPLHFPPFPIMSA